MKVAFENNKFSINFETKTEIEEFVDMYQTYKGYSEECGEDFTLNSMNTIQPIIDIIEKLEYNKSISILNRCDCGFSHLLSDGTVVELYCCIKKKNNL